jgi:2-hydroxychromene-2-carboxylate isomerase
VVAQVLVEAGAEVAGFGDYLAGPGRQLHDRLQADVFAAGIFGVPSYVVAGEVFFGREHLPMVRWLLTGRSGAAPDIGYRNFGTSDDSA